MIEIKLYFCVLCAICHLFSLQSCQLDAACDVYNAYVKPRSSPVRLQLDQKIITDMDQFIQGNKVSWSSNYTAQTVLYGLCHTVLLQMACVGPLCSAVIEQTQSISWPDGIKGNLNQGQFGFVRFNCLGFFVLCIIFSQPSLSGLLCQVLASQAVSNDAYVEEYISTKTSCMRVC